MEPLPEMPPLIGYIIGADEDSFQCIVTSLTGIEKEIYLRKEKFPDINSCKFGTKFKICTTLDDLLIPQVGIELLPPDNEDTAEYKEALKIINSNKGEIN